jgi:hypothetical protein
VAAATFIIRAIGLRGGITCGNETGICRVLNDNADGILAGGEGVRGESKNGEDGIGKIESFEGEFENEMKMTRA